MQPVCEYRGCQQAHSQLNLAGLFSSGKPLLFLRVLCLGERLLIGHLRNKRHRMITVFIYSKCIGSHRTGFLIGCAWWLIRLFV